MGEAKLDNLPSPQKEYFAYGRARLSPEEKDYLDISEVLASGHTITILPEEYDFKVLQDPSHFTVFLRDVFPEDKNGIDDVPRMTIQNGQEGESPTIQLTQLGPSIFTGEELYTAHSETKAPIKEGISVIYSSKGKKLYSLRFVNNSGIWHMTFVDGFSTKKPDRLDTMRKVNLAGIPKIEELRRKLEKNSESGIHL